MADGGKTETKKSVKFPHNPVTGRCAYKKANFTINTFNINNNKISSALKVDEIKKDIIFLQESKKEDKIQGDYVYTFKPQGPIHNGMLVKDSVFEIDPENNYKYGHRWHAIILRRRAEPKKKIVAISWHGPRNVLGTEKKEAFNELIKFAQKIRRDYSAPAIIGGDFNVVEKTVRDWLKTKDEFKIEALEKENLKGYRKGKKSIDFFVHSSDLEISSINSIDITEKLKNLNNGDEGDNDESNDDEGDNDESNDDEGDNDKSNDDEGDNDESNDDESNNDRTLTKKMGKINLSTK